MKEIFNSAHQDHQRFQSVDEINIKYEMNEAKWLTFRTVMMQTLKAVQSWQTPQKVSVANFYLRKWQGLRTVKLIAPNFYHCLAAHHVEKFGEVIPTDARVISQNALNNFRILIIKKLLGGPVPDILYVIKPWSFYTTCKNLSWQHPVVAEIWSCEKADYAPQLVPAGTAEARISYGNSVCPSVCHNPVVYQAQVR